MKRHLATALLSLLLGCEALIPAAKTALAALLPLASERLTKAVVDRFATVDEEGTVCVSLEIEDEDGFRFIACRGTENDLLRTAADALTAEVPNIDRRSAVCFGLGLPDRQGNTYVTCQGKPAEAAE